MNHAIFTFMHRIIMQHMGDKMTIHLRMSHSERIRKIYQNAANLLRRVIFDTHFQII